MYNLMLVEDEPIVLEGMLKIIDFSAYGFEVVCSCSNGLEALKLYRIHKPDVVITDICMEIMDGLEFIEQVSEEARDTKFVIVSGHQDFKFFKKALSLRVTDYILKPVTAKEFRELLIKIAKELDAVASGLVVSEYKEQLSELREIENNMFFNKLMHIKPNPKDLKEHLDTIGVSFPNPYYQVAIFKMNSFELLAERLGYDSPSVLLSQLYLKLTELSHQYNHKVIFVAPEGYVLMIINGANKDNMISFIQSLTNQIQYYYSQDYLGSVDCYAGFIMDGVNDIPDSFKSANRLNICGVLNNQRGLYESEKILFQRSTKSYDYVKEMYEWIN
ncbi:MAG: response regulator, partial [Vallitaleaceae bacterium]|nr:response regulator [Vallitaleaceae bacterium]